MLTCGRDTDRRSDRQVGANADRLRGMIIVDSLPKTVTSTNSNWAKEVRVRSVLPMLIYRSLTLGRWPVGWLHY
jgi:hypothetical protein